MLAVTQFEVYVLENGRWTLHARYPAEDRKQALWDARSTEMTTGFPSKVVRETYFPDLNDSERITTYISPRAKKATKSKSVEDSAREQGRPLLRGRLRRHRPQEVSLAHVALRVLVAAGFSLIGATLTAATINWALRRFASLGLYVPTSLESMLLTYSYVGMFLLFFLSLFRSRLPLHRLIADLWHKSHQTELETAKAKDPAQPLRLKPKHDRSNSPETLKEWQDLRMRRGDPDIFAEAGAEADAGPSPPPAQVAAVPLPPALNAPPPPKPEPVKAEKPSEKLFEKSKPQPAKAEPKPAQKPKPAEIPAPVLDDETDFAHVELLRFITEVARPAVLATMPDDPVTRRAVALLVSGAMDALAEQPAAKSAVPVNLLAWGLKQAGLTPGVIDLFVMQRSIHVALASNQALVSEGRAAMAHLLASDLPIAAVVDAMATALAVWRTPFGQPGLLVAAPAEVSPVESFLITEMRPRTLQAETPEQAAENEARLAAHNARVRNALAENQGNELKHTGRGIFAHFADVPLALACARELRNQLGPAIAIAVVGKSHPEEDPTVSSALFLRAEAAVAQTRDGSATVEAHVMGEADSTHQPADIIPLSDASEPPVGDAALVA